MATTYLHRTPSSASNRKTFTISTWVKRANISTTLGTLLLCSYTNASNYTNFYIGSSDKLTVNSSGTGSACFIETNRLFRDASAWYHIVIAVDTTQGTASDRVKIYINGVQETSFASTTYFGSSVDTLINNTVSTNINRNQYGTVQGDSSMSHYHFCDGQALAPTVFGETDATTGEWKIKTAPSFTPGTNGFTILKDGNTITDQSANSNNFTLGGGTLTNTEDCPSDVFATVNPLWFNSSTFTNGNLTVAGGSAHRPNIPTLAASSGKYYFEAKMISGNTNKWWLGYADQEYLDTRQYLTSNLDLGGGNISGGTNQKNGCVTAGWGNALQQSPVSTIQNFFSSAGAANDIMAMAIDLDNQKIWWSLNGTWRNGSASASTTFNASYPDSTNLDAGRNYYLCCGSENSKWSVNYGNGFFGTTAISSEGSNASGIGKFEYDVPTGYTALSTKGLNL